MRVDHRATRLGALHRAPRGFWRPCVASECREVIMWRCPTPLTTHGHRPGAACWRAPTSMSTTHVEGVRDVDAINAQSTVSPSSHTGSLSYSVDDASSRSQRMPDRGFFPTAQTGSWEKDMNVHACRKCMRKFTLFFRKHHCRRCGRIYCDACTSHRAYIPENVHITDPAIPEMLDSEIGSAVRICDWCMNEYHIEPAHPRVKTAADDDTSAWSHVLGRIGLPWSGEESPVDPDALNTCPVCDLHLRTLASTQEREQHVATCLEDGVSPSRALQMHFLVSRLAEDSALIGRECIICMEDFAACDRVARLTCMCCFHADCIRQWMAKGHACPVHATDN